MKNTNTKAFKNQVNSYIVDCIDPEAYGAEATTDKEKVTFLLDCFAKEYGHEIKRKGNVQDALAEWFSGLPSVFGIEFSYYDILERAKKWHEVESFTEKEEDMICEKWWAWMACKVLQLAHKLEVPFPA